MIIDLGFVPRKHQREAHANRKRFSVLVWHRRSGKTVFSVLELLLSAMATVRERARFGYVAPYYRQAKLIAWDYLKHYAKAVPGVEVHEAELSVHLPNGAEIRLFGADNPDALRGLYFDGIVLDEVADMRPQVWGEIIRPALTDREGWALFIGTPKGTNLFSDLYFAALKDPETWYSDLRRVSETDSLPAEEIERARGEMSDSQWAQEMECDFAASANDVLCPLSSVLDAEKRDVPERKIDGYPLILGVDVARYGGDRSVAFLRRGCVAFNPSIWRDIDLMELSSRVATIADKKKPAAIFIDQGGMGAGVVDRLRQLGFVVTGVDFGSRALDERFQNRRAEMWWSMAEWLKTGCIPTLPELIADLTSPTYTHRNAAGRLQLESKDSLRDRGRPSPDLADALALTFAEPVAIAQSPLAAKASYRVQTEYDPYAREASR